MDKTYTTMSVPTHVRDALAAIKGEGSYGDVILELIAMNSRNVKKLDEISRVQREMSNAQQRIAEEVGAPIEHVDFEEDGPWTVSLDIAGVTFTGPGMETEQEAEAIKDAIERNSDADTDNVRVARRQQGH